METVHHVHADDVAQVFFKAIGNWSASVGEAFHAVAPAAVSLRGYAEAVAAWFSKEPRLRFLYWLEWKALQSTEDAQATWEHVYRSPSARLAKAETRLGYRPRYTSFEAVFESVTWLMGARGRQDGLAGGRRRPLSPAPNARPPGPKQR
jgi:nucleoside-diphosphate-sugar epimerase